MTAAEQIVRLRDELEATPLLSKESFAIQDRLRDAVKEDLTRAIDAGEIPVYRITELVVVAIHPSAQQLDMLQATSYATDGILGDRQYRNVEEVMRGEGLTHHERLSEAAASTFLEQSVAAEGRYQARRQQKKTAGMSL